ncbi:MAG: ABC transporter ATP-binding protein [Geminicoccaceae bacterium]
MPILALNGVSKRFGSFRALSDLSFDVETGEIFGVAGPNGAGKSTLLNVCSGALKPSEGEIRFDGRRVDGLKPYALCHRGIARIFQIPQVFSSLSIRENVRTACMFGGGPSDGAIEDVEDEVLRLAGIESQAERPAATADLMTRKMTMLAAALATRPRVLLMDEPLAGLNPGEIDAFADLILELRRKRDLAIVVVEHKVRALRRISDRILILDFGSLLSLGEPDEVMNDPKVVEVYLGSPDAA